MVDDEDANELNSCYEIYLISHEQAPDTLDLQLVVYEARVDENLSKIETGSAEIDAVLGEGYAVRHDPSCRVFVITFKNYVGFSIRDESYAEPNPVEDYSKKLRTYAKSPFLDFIASSTFAQHVVQEPILHFAIVCGDHVVDVACTTAPTIELKTPRHFNE